MSAVEDDVPCRCGKPALLDVTISAAVPHDYSARGCGGRRTELYFQSAACRQCAFDAAREVLRFLDEQLPKERK